MQPRITRRPCHRLALLLAFAPAVCAGFDLSEVQDGSRQRPATPIGGEDIGARGDHPLQPISSLMADVQSRLASQNTSPETQALQRSIIDGLTRLIDQQSQSSEPAGGASSPAQQPDAANGQRPATADGDGPTQSAEEATDDSSSLLRRIWGQLPDQVRQQISTPLQEQFLPQYDEVIQQYFKRLANESPE